MNIITYFDAKKSRICTWYHKYIKLDEKKTRLYTTIMLSLNIICLLKEIRIIYYLCYEARSISLWLFEWKTSLSTKSIISPLSFIYFANISPICSCCPNKKNCWVPEIGVYLWDEFKAGLKSIPIKPFLSVWKHEIVSEG